MIESLSVDKNQIHPALDANLTLEEIYRMENNHEQVEVRRWPLQ